MLWMRWARGATSMGKGDSGILTESVSHEGTEDTEGRSFGKERL